LPGATPRELSSQFPNQVRTRGQSQGRQENWHHHSGAVPAARRRGDRVSCDSHRASGRRSAIRLNFSSIFLMLSSGCGASPFAPHDEGSQNLAPLRRGFLYRATAFRPASLMAHNGRRSTSARHAHSVTTAPMRHGCSASVCVAYAAARSSPDGPGRSLAPPPVQPFNSASVTIAGMNAPKWRSGRPGCVLGVAWPPYHFPHLNSRTPALVCSWRRALIQSAVSVHCRSRQTCRSLSK
jgi:hypothetical protein